MVERWGKWTDGHTGIALGALISFYLAVVLTQASAKLLWADELITYYISRQRGFTGIWRALEEGADPNPPLMHLLVKASTALLGGNALGMRLPSILCVMVAIVAMWWMLRRWVQPVFALTGVLAFMATRGFDYAYDARSYGPMMGFAMMSLALWMLSSDVSGWRRAAALAGMALALALGVSSNYYGVLAFFPIAVGELVGRRWRLGVWVAMAFASLPLIAYLPLIWHDVAEFGPHAWNRPQLSMLAMSYVELVEAIFWPVLGLGIYAIWNREKLKTASSEVAPRDPEIAAVGVLLGYPFLGYAIAVGVAGMISPRCVVPVCCGIGLVAGILGQRVFGVSSRAGMAVVLGLVVWVGVREGVCANILQQQRHAFFRLQRIVGGIPAERVVVSDSTFVLPVYFYSGAESRDMVVCPVDFARIHQLEADDSGEQNLWGGRDGVFPFRVIGVSAALKGLSRVILVGRPDGWLALAMRQRGFNLSFIGDETDWGRVGGIFTPMAHSETRIMIATWQGH